MRAEHRFWKTLFPALTGSPGSQVPILVAAAIVGTVFFILMIPLTFWLAEVSSRAGSVFTLVASQALNRPRMPTKLLRMKADASFYEAAFNARLASELLAAGYGIRRTDRDFELASVSRELIDKFSKRTRIIEEPPIKQQTILEAKARALFKETGMEFADAFAVIRSELAAKSQVPHHQEFPDPRKEVS